MQEKWFSKTKYSNLTVIVINKVIMAFRMEFSVRLT
jgi:hypothetical protein